MRGVPSLVLVAFRTAIGASGAMVTASPARAARHRGRYGGDRLWPVAGTPSAVAARVRRARVRRTRVEAAAPQRRDPWRPWPPTAGHLGRSTHSPGCSRLFAGSASRCSCCPMSLSTLSSSPAPLTTSSSSPAPKGAQLRRSNVTRQWRKALEAAGLTEIHFHDLRHTGNTLAGEAGASLRELMDRMGHSTTRAALIYQHRTSLRDRMIADEISRRAEAERTRSGAQRARDNGEAS
jgi:hypothetical protein